jgi:RNA polymerase sigma factor (sigma-70 family)
MQRFTAGHEESAFEALVLRHGPMVLAVCRRVLGNLHDAEDAFQATFLLLARKAGSLQREGSVGNWLYGVATRLSLRARAAAARRRDRERRAAAWSGPDPLADLTVREAQQILDEELARLPDRYRAALVLCCLEGMTRDDAARQLGCLATTLKCRLERARAMLRKRLGRRGLTLPAAMLASLLTDSFGEAAVPALLGTSTVKAAVAFATGSGAGALGSPAAVALAEGALKTMLLTKLKLATAVLVVVAVLGASAAALTRQVPAADPPVQPGAQTKEPGREKKATAARPAQAKKEGEALPAVVTGLVKTVDVPKSALTVAHGKGETTFRVAKGADITIDGKAGDLAAVPAGASVHLRQFVDPRTARSILAEGRWLGGVLKAVDAGKSTVTFDDRAQPGAAGKTFNVAKGTFISIDGKPGKLAGVPNGASVNLQLCADQQTVRSLSAEGAAVSGLVKAVDAAKRTVTLNDTTYPVAKNAHIGIDHKPGDLTGLPAGANATLNLCVNQKTVLRISAGGSSVFGTVKAVDAQKGTITVTGRPDDRTFRVPAGIVITIDNKPGRLGGIPVGASLHCLNLCVDQQTAHSINVIGPGLHHVPVQGVDAGKRTITFGDKAPPLVAGKTLAVAPDANITIDGKPGDLAAVPAGSFVNAGLSVDQQTALSLQAEGPNLGDCGGSMVSAVDPEKGTITFADRGAAAVAGKTFTVLKDAHVVIDGRPGTLAGIPTGSYVNLTLTVDQTAVRSIGAQGPRVAGVVKAVDVAKSALTVGGMTYTVAKDALIVIDGKQRPLADLAAGAAVHVNLRVDRRTVGMIQTTAH